MVFPIQGNNVRYQKITLLKQFFHTYYLRRPNNRVGIQLYKKDNIALFLQSIQLWWSILDSSYSLRRPHNMGNPSPNYAQRNLQIYLPGYTKLKEKLLAISPLPTLQRKQRPQQRISKYFLSNVAFLTTQQRVDAAHEN